MALNKGTIFAKNADFLQKNAGISKRSLVLNDIFSKTKYMGIRTDRI